MEQCERKEERRLSRWQIGCQAKVKLEGAEDFADCHINDINFKCLRIILKQKLPTDTFLRLTLCLTEDCSVSAQVWVVWHKTLTESNVYGLYFSRIADTDKEKIYKFMLQNFPRQVYNRWWQGLGYPDSHLALSDGKCAPSGAEDRRIFARFKANLHAKVLHLASNKECAVEVSDFCANGIGLAVDEEIPARAALEMWIQISDKGEPLYTRGEVAWSKKAGLGSYRVGVNLERADLMGLSRVLRLE